MGNGLFIQRVNIFEPSGLNFNLTRVIVWKWIVVGGSYYNYGTRKPRKVLYTRYSKMDLEHSS